MEEQIIIQFLTSFFRLFKANIEEYRMLKNQIHGVVGWNDNSGKQAFSWHFENEKFSLKTKLLCDYLNDNSLVDTDLITISETELLSRLINHGWTQDEAKKAVDDLCKIGVRMVDEGEETDFFFVHF